MEDSYRSWMLHNESFEQQRDAPQLRFENLVLTAQHGTRDARSRPLANTMRWSLTVECVELGDGPSPCRVMTDGG
jgi:hypothetical protein